MKLHHRIILFLLGVLSVWWVVDVVRDSGGTGSGLEQVESELGREQLVSVNADLEGGGAVDPVNPGALRTPDEAQEPRKPVAQGPGQVCTGKVFMPDGKVLPEGAVVIAYGDAWPSGEESKRATVGPGGEFRVTFAPGTYRGFIKLEALGWKLSAHGVWRDWFEEPLLLTAVPSDVFAVRLVDGTGGDVQDLRLDRLHWGRLHEDARKPVRAMAGGAFMDPLRWYEKDRYLAWGPGLAPVLLDPRAPEAEAASEAPVVLRKPARVSGTIDFGQSGAGGSGWLESNQPFRIVTDGELGPLTTHMSCTGGPFEFEVPAGQNLELRVGAKGLDSPWTVVGSLTTGEHRRDVRLKAKSVGGFQGRILDPKGEPVVGAWVRSLASLYSFDGSTLDPGMGAMHETLTDDEGRFVLKGSPHLESLPLEVSVDPARPGNVPAGEPWSPERASQHFEEVKRINGGASLTFAPGDSIFKGRVVDVDGKPVSEYLLTLYPSDRMAKGPDQNMIDDALEIDSSPLLNEGATAMRSRFPTSPFKAQRCYLIQSPEGVFELQVPAGKWDLKVNAEGQAQAVRSGVAVPSVGDLTVTVPGSASLKVLLKDDLGGPWANLKLRLRESDVPGQPAHLKTADKTGGWNFWSDADGTAQLDGLTPGEYELYTLGAHMYSFPKLQVSLKGGETELVEVRMASFGSIQTKPLWEGDGRIVEATLYSNGRIERATLSNTGRKIRRIGSVQTAQGSFFPEVKPGDYTLRFHVEDEVPGPQPLFSEVSVEVRSRVVSHVTMAPASRACFVNGRVTLNGQAVGGGSLKFNELGSNASRKKISVGPGGGFHATLSKPGTYRVLYFEGIRDRKVSLALVNVPPKEGPPLELAFEAGQITLQLVQPFMQESNRRTDFPESIRLSLLNDQGVSMGGFYPEWSKSTATWKQVPPGTYRVLGSGNLLSHMWRVEPGQQVTLAPGVAQVTGMLELERLYAMTVEYDLSDWPLDTKSSRELYHTAIFRVWADPKMESQLLYKFVDGVPVNQIEVQGLPEGPVWVTIDPDPPRAYEPSQPQGPFQVTPEGLQGVHLRFAFPAESPD